VLAALATCVVHSLFDSVASVPYVAVTVTLLLALLLENNTRYQNGVSEQPRNALLRKLKAWGLAAAWVILLTTALWSLKGSTFSSKGVTAAALGEWRLATDWFERAARHDPGHAYYRLQAGFARGRMAQGGADDVDAALTHYEAGIERSPNYALNSLNIGTLRREAGSTQQALAWIERAVEHAPRSALAHLNLGAINEELGRQNEAKHHYERSLTLAPGWTDAFFWRSTPLRVQARQAWVAAHRAEPGSRGLESPKTAGEWHRGGLQAMDDGRVQDALDAFGRAVALNPHRTRHYVAQARAMSFQGRENDAERLLRTALLAEGGAEMDRVRAEFALAQLDFRRGDSEEAIHRAHAAIDRARFPGTHLSGSWGHIDYAYYLFHTPAVPEALLPQVAVITVTDEVAEWMLQLGTWYEEVQDNESAARVYRELLEEVPDATKASRSLDAIVSGE